MGTRADFYVGRGGDAEWLGSVAFDGGPFDMPDALIRSTSESMFRREMSKFLSNRDDATFPEMGWPWPWDDSTTTDFAYAFENASTTMVVGKVWAFSVAWFDPLRPEPATKIRSHDDIFPDMSERKNVARGKRSGLI